jgi:uncharacterized membrane protein YfcA
MDLDLSLPALALVTLASVAAGAVNAVAGGGTLVAFPALTAVGVPAVEAGITTTTALTPGYLGGTLAQRADLAGQGGRLRALAPVGVAGGLAGARLLSVTTEGVFRLVVPWLIFAACGLLIAQDRVRAALERRRQRRREDHPRPTTAAGPVLVAVTFVAAVYGGYFGAGLGIILLAVLGVALDDDLRRLNALKQSLSFVISVSAAVLLLFSGRLPWVPAACVAGGSLAGGTLGGRIAGRLDPTVLRRAVAAVGVAVGVVYLVRR